jgi:4-amino-4-deoxy-L-arabinose transferase-like glycosyltransferase
VTDGDSAELTVAAATLGVPHPPGYPLYVLIGRLFAAVPIGDVAFRLNVMSGVFGALAALLVYATVLELTRRRESALVAALSLAFSYHFWAESLVAEVYTMDAALLAGLLYALCRWGRTRDQRLLYAAFLLLGLSLATRTTSLLLVPPLLIWGAMSGAWRYGPELLRGLAITISALALYFVLPVADLGGARYIWSIGYDLHGAPVHADLAAVEGLRWYVSAEIFRPLVFAYAPSDAWPELRWYSRWLFQEFLVVGLLLGVAGLGYAWRRDRAFALLTVAIFLMQAGFFVNYGAADKDQMLLPTALLWSVWIGLGARAVQELLARSTQPRARALVATLLLAFPVALFAANVSSVQPDTSASASVDGLLREARPGALVIGSWSKIERLEYYQKVKGQRPDLRLVQQWPLSADALDRLVSANIDTQTIYVTDEIASLREGYALVNAGDWFVVQRLRLGRRTRVPA